MEWNGMEWNGMNGMELKDTQTNHERAGARNYSMDKLEWIYGWKGRMSIDSIDNG